MPVVNASAADDHNSTETRLDHGAWWAQHAIQLDNAGLSGEKFWNYFEYHLKAICSNMYLNLKSEDLKIQFFFKTIGHIEYSLK